MFRTLTVLLLAALVPAAGSAQGNALRTAGARTLGKGLLEIGAGTEFLMKSEAPFAGAPRSVWRVPALYARWGAAPNVDVEFGWTGRLLAGYAGGSTGSDWGDPVIGTVIMAFEERDGLPSLGLRTAVKLPSTSYLPYYLGSDQTDFFCSLLASRRTGGVEARLNIGLAILGNPRELGSQDDIYSASLAVLVELGAAARIFAEAYGMSGYKADDDKLLLRSGLTGEFGCWQAGVYGGLRAAGSSADFGAAFSGSEDWIAGLFCAREFTL